MIDMKVYFDMKIIDFDEKVFKVSKLLLLSNVPKQINKILSCLTLPKALLACPVYYWSARETPSGFKEFLHKKQLLPNTASCFCPQV